MPNNEAEERFRWIKPILDKEITFNQMAEICPFSERTLKEWKKRFLEQGMDGLIPLSRRPKSHPNETPIHLKEKIIEMRNAEKKCALKLKWDLDDEGIRIGTRTVGKIIKREGLTKKYKVRRIKYKYVRREILPGWLIEIDVKFVPKKLGNKRYYQYTAIDVASRWRHIQIFDEQSNYNSIRFLQEVIRRFPCVIKAIKTDNHSTFTNRSVGYLKSSDPQNPRLHALDVFCQEHGIEHYLIDKGKPAQNGTVERSHRSDQETFYDEVKLNSPDELRLKARLWNMYYNDLKHCGLNGITPNQALQSAMVQYVRA